MRVDAHGDAVVDGLADVDGGAAVVPRAEGERGFAHGAPCRLLADPVDHAARTAAAEDHRVRAFQRFDAVDVVEVAVVLDVVADAVDEEVAGRAVAAEDGGVAVAFALGGDDARHVADHVGHALHRLVAHQFLGDHGDRLRRVAQQGVGLGGGRARLGVVAALGDADDLHFLQRGRSAGAAVWANAAGLPSMAAASARRTAAAAGVRRVAEDAAGAGKRDVVICFA